MLVINGQNCGETRTYISRFPAIFNLNLGNNVFMRSISGKEFVKILERHGWALLRVKGSHHIYGKPGSEVRISVPIHGNESLKMGLLRHFLKQASLTEKDL